MSAIAELLTAERVKGKRKSISFSMALFMKVMPAELATYTQMQASVERRSRRDRAAGEEVSTSSSPGRRCITRGLVRRFAGGCVVALV